MDIAGVAKLSKFGAELEEKAAMKNTEMSTTINSASVCFEEVPQHLNLTLRIIIAINITINKPENDHRCLYVAIQHRHRVSLSGTRHSIAHALALHTLAAGKLVGVGSHNMCCLQKFERSEQIHTTALCRRQEKSKRFRYSWPYDWNTAAYRKKFHLKDCMNEL